jgi:hypothetical protein
MEDNDMNQNHETDMEILKSSLNSKFDLFSNINGSNSKQDSCYSIDLNKNP